jgi:molybdopterin-synthase adenylyltransferase
MSSRSRQSFLGPQSDETLASSGVGIIGLGGGGSHIAQQLAHVGVGNFFLFDHDKVEDTNLNRLVGATAEDVNKGTLKTNISCRMIKGINPRATVVTVPKHWQEEPDLLRNCDAVFGCVDTYAARDEIERACRRSLIPYIDIGMDVTAGENGYVISGQVILSMPGEICMRCMGFLNEKILADEAGLYGAAGGRPQVIWPNGVLASVAVGHFVQLLTPWHKARTPVYLEYDGNAQTLLPSNRLAYVSKKSCDHFSSATDIGDPFWAMSFPKSGMQSPNP